MKRPGRLPLLWLLAAVLAGLALSQLLQTSRPLGRLLDAGDPRLPRVLGDAAAPASGPPDADVTLVVFSDYQCGVCREDHPALLEAVRADGRVRVIYKDWPIFGARSLAAARVAIAAGYQGRHEAVHDALMQRPGGLSGAALRKAASAAGADWPRLQAELAARRAEIDALISRNAAQAGMLGLPGTPGYLIGRTLILGRLGEGGFRRAFVEARDDGGA